MQILFLGQHFAPEEISGAVLATELAAEFVERGHQVSFVSCFPNYPYGKTFFGYKNKLLGRESIDGVQVIRVWSYISPTKSLLRRLINYGSFSFMAFWGTILAGNCDILFSFSPPLPLGISAFLVSRFRKVPWLLRVEDLFPDAAIQMGYFRNRLVQKFLYAMELWLYKKADLIAVISEQFREIIILKGVPAEKVVVIPVWSDQEKVTPTDRNNSFRKEMGMEDCFVVLYSGNIGFTSCLKDLVEAADCLRDESAIHFLVIGEGVKKQEIQDFITAKNLENVSLLPYQPRDRYNEVLGSADLNIVTLNRQSSRSSFPMKTFNAMASGRPILAIAPKESELGKLICSNRIGVVVEPGQPERLADVILELRAKPGLLAKMGMRGRELVLSHFTKDRCVSLFEQKMVELEKIHSYFRSEI